jgi:1-deoxy-D-xylulose-5-phosphate reductoisomerase
MPHVKSNLAILGSTGSIGTQTLSILDEHVSAYQLVLLTAYRSVDLLFNQAIKYKPKYLHLSCSDSAKILQQKIQFHQLPCRVISQSELFSIICSDEIDSIVAAMVGACGLHPIFHAIQASKRVFLANKEVLVMAGYLLRDLLAKSQASLIPLDSEHNAVFQMLPLLQQQQVASGIPDLAGFGVEKIILTASGGPFLNKTQAQLKLVSASDACTHPNWKMGKKISVDSATLMNKGLEWIEACHLFQINPHNIEVWIHPNSYVHALISFKDGSTCLHAADHDMRVAIGYGLSWPERWALPVNSLSLTQWQSCQFDLVDESRFPCFSFAKQAFLANDASPLILNAANEIAVDAFLNERIAFLDIAYLVEKALNELKIEVPKCIDEILVADQKIRSQVSAFINQSKSNFLLDAKSIASMC